MENLEILKEPIRQNLNSFFAASVKKDVSYMKKNLHEEYVFTSPRSIVMNKQSFIDFIGNKDNGLEVFEMTEEHTSVIEKAAVTTGMIEAKFKEKELFKIRATMAFVNVNNSWLLLAFQETLIP